MNKKVYELKIDEKSVKSSAASKKVKAKKEPVKSEVETLGFVEINNKAGKVEAHGVGYEKVATNETKKAVKSELNHIEDYFDFSFRPETVVEVKAEPKAKATKAKKATTKACSVKAEKTTTKACKAKTEKATDKKTTTKAATKKACKKAEVVVEKVEAVPCEVLKMQASEDGRQSEVVAKACNCFAYDEEANNVVAIARMGYLFG